MSSQRVTTVRIDTSRNRRSDSSAEEDTASLPTVHEKAPPVETVSSGSTAATSTLAADSSSQYGESFLALKAARLEIQESENYHQLPFSYPCWKKWTILVIIFFVQVSMNFNTSIYANAIVPMASHFSISEATARLGQMSFLIAYAFGSELWAPWSEELGRWPVMQLSLLLVNTWQVLCALAPNFSYIVAGRTLGGLSSAGGSVTMGMIADMWEPDQQQYAVAFIVLSSVAGSVVGPIAGGFMEVRLHWRWNFWIQLILGAVVQLAHFLLVPETRSTIVLNNLAKKQRKSGIANVYGPLELRGSSLTFTEVITIWVRPFSMFVREPIVLFLSLLSGFSDALIFTFLESFRPVYSRWDFDTIQTGLAFIPIMVGYFLAYFSFFPVIVKDKRAMARNPDGLDPESRLWWLLFTAPLETIGLFGFAWTSMGPPAVHWFAPMFFSMLIAIANYCIYMATIDYMVASYGPYSASATGGNALARDFLAGIAALYSTPMYRNIKHKYHLEMPSTILGCISFLVTVPIYIFYWKGPQIRARSKFAQGVARNRNELKHRRAIHERSSVDAGKLTDV
ncbi:MFS multidrug transporter, putative [Trichophyton verrucosum HKI 0517]|uniref:MFS multidrug transporter, putative n=1 Tax=Trichophyton verrucosum (strain HKI 0517) TaxID=663202 RepID=D4DAU4_TRIVH|nr:MFS multidrug transporter, putative [Trichophyton verrucosum HKI 0517]EFE41044.1 MFS multidrug transporter, putative [Trichophyton verrucosum HKI 0517]